MGVLDGEDFSTPDRGTTQGSALSPLLGNIYLHFVLDVWFDREIRPRRRGRAQLVRHADDFVIGFEHEEDAKRVMEVLPKRMGCFGLEIHPDKTRLLAFGQPPRSQQTGHGPATFEFLGFTFYWTRSRRGTRVPRVKTRRARLRRAIHRASDWCRRHRHWPVEEQHAMLSAKLRGHYAYFGVNGDYRSLALLHRAVERAWCKWLRRRSRRTTPTTWARFRVFPKVYPLPKPKICVQIW